MARRWRKQKSAQQTAKRRKVMKGTGDSSSATGAIGGFRRFARNLVGGGKKSGGEQKSKSTASRVLDLALWAAVAVAAYVVVNRQCMR